MSSSTRRRALRAGVLSTVAGGRRCSPAPPRRSPTSPPSPARPSRATTRSSRCACPPSPTPPARSSCRSPCPPTPRSPRCAPRPGPGWTATIDHGPAEPAGRAQRAHHHRGGQHRHLDRRPGHPDRARRVRRLPALARPAARRYRPAGAAGRADLRRRRGRGLGPAAGRRRIRAGTPGPGGHADPDRRAPGEPAAAAAGRRPPPTPAPAGQADPTARWLGGAGLLVGALGLGPRGRRACCGPGAAGGRTDDHPGCSGPSPSRCSAALALLLGAAPAFAHTRLQSSDPADGASLDAGPQRVSLTFNEPMQAGFATVTVIGPDTTALPVRGGQRGRRHGHHRGRAARPGRPLRDRLPGGLRGRAPGHRVGRVHADRARSGRRRPRPRRPAAAAGGRARRRPPAAAAPAPAAASSGDDGGTPVWPWIVGGVLLIGIGAVAALRLGRS